jgi:AraC-like DNA-binding protein/mannose-6-phosphate isomerase-like protein (cupin superfamily)
LNSYFINFSGAFYDMPSCLHPSTYSDSLQVKEGTFMPDHDGEIRKKAVLGGLRHHYYRAAAWRMEFFRPTGPKNYLLAMSGKELVRTIFHNLGEKTPSNTQPIYVGLGTLRHPVQYAHLHHGVEIGAVKSGNGMLYYSGKFYPMKPGDVYFVNSMHPHSHGTTGPGTMDLIYIQIKQEAVILVPPPKNDLRLYEPFWYPPGVLPPVIRKPNRLHADVLSAYRLFQTSPQLSSLRAWVHVLSALISLAETMEPLIRESHQNLAHPQRENIMRALQFIHDRYLDPISVEDMASQCNLSVSHFSHIFTQVMQISPVEYRNKLRITRSCEQLATTNIKVSAIALECGFNSLSQFNELFRRITGASPNELRKKP